MDQLNALKPTSVEEIQKVLFLRKMPTHIRDIVNPRDFTELPTLTERCKEIWKNRRQDIGTAAAAIPRQQTTCCRQAKHPPFAHAWGSRGDGYCYYHTCFGSRANKCENGCIYQEKKATQTAPAGHSQPCGPHPPPPPHPPYQRPPQKCLSNQQKHTQQFLFLVRFRRIAVHLAACLQRTAHRSAPVGANGKTFPAGSFAVSMSVSRDKSLSLIFFQLLWPPLYLAWIFLLILAFL